MLPSRLSKLALAARPLNQVHRLGAVRCMSASLTYAQEREMLVKMKASMDDLPVPSMTWEEGYKKYNTRWNIELALSTALVVLMTIKMYYSNELYTYPLVNLDEFAKWRKERHAKKAEEE